MISLQNVTQNFTNRTLFKEVSLSIFDGEKIGLTGPNGAGKSTLFSLLRGEREPTEGTVQSQKNMSIGYLPQEARFTSDRTVLDEVTSGDARIRRLLNEKRRLEDEGRAGTMPYGDILQELETLGIYDLEHKAEKILSGLGFPEADHQRPIRELSGGWQMRALLAKLLVYPYELLLLDEPTNYLDLGATLWLKDFLKAYQGTYIMISHDRDFLNDVTNYTIILERGQMTKVKGNYEEYERQKEIEIKHLERRKKTIDKKRQQLERFARRFHAQPNRASAVRNKRKMIERLEEIDLPQDQESIRDFEFPSARPSGYSVIELRNVARAYGSRTVYENLDLSIMRGQKICLVGPNGAGKSTLLKMMAGVLDPDQGDIRLGHQVQRGYFSQSRLDVLSPNRTVLDELSSAVTTSVPQTQMRSLLGLFNFHNDDVFKTVNVLSGGEKSRLILAKLLINPPNFMLLDEPTTHLDLDGVRALTTAFQKYQGTLCFISHDLYFIRQVADHIVEVEQGRIRSYPGGLEYYLDKKHGRIPDGKQALSADPEIKARKMNTAPAADPQQKRPQKENSKARISREKHKAAKRRLSQIRKEIAHLQKQIKELDTETYVKSRVLSNAYGKSPDLLKEYGRRLKEIPKVQRKCAEQVRRLKEEKEQIER
ncbi:MAG: ATP-binding cassette domain-containing protein [Candidatus Omnitrophota bacterium]